MVAACLVHVDDNRNSPQACTCLCVCIPPFPSGMFAIGSPLLSPGSGGYGSPSILRRKVSRRGSAGVRAAMMDRLAHLPSTSTAATGAASAIGLSSSPPAAHSAHGGMVPDFNTAPQDVDTAAARKAGRRGHLRGAAATPSQLVPTASAPAARRQRARRKRGRSATASGTAASPGTRRSPRQRAVAAAASTKRMRAR